MKMSMKRKVPDELKTLKRRGETLREQRGKIEFLIIMIDVKNASNNGMNCLNGSYPLTLVTTLL